MKARFKADFGEEPFVDVDTAYFADQDMPRVADARFTWMTFNLPAKMSRSRLNGHVIDHAMHEVGTRSAGTARARSRTRAIAW